MTHTQLTITTCLDIFLYYIERDKWMRWRFLDVFVLVVMLMVVSFEQSATAQQLVPFATEIRRDLASHLEGGLPEMTELVPGYRPPTSFLPSLIIGNFEIESQDGIPWGGILGQILRWRIPFGPHLLVRIPHPEPDRFRADLYIPGLDPKQIATGLEAVSIAYPRLGIENALVGKGRITSTTFTLSCDLYSLPARQLAKHFDFAGPLSDLPETLNQLILPVLEAIGVQLDEGTHSYLVGNSTSSFEELRRYGQFIVESNGNPTPDVLLAKAVSIWKEGIRLAGFVPLYCYALAQNSERLGEEINTQLQEIKERFKGHPAVEAYVYRMWYTEEGESPTIDFYTAYQQLVRDNPLDPIPLVRFGRLALDPKQASFQGIVVTLWAAEFFPMNYRSWWSLSTDLMNMGALLAAEDQSGDLTERCLAYSELCLDRALAMHPVSTELWQEKVNRMVQMEGLSPKTFELIEKVVEYGQRNPQYLRYWYNQAAMNNYGGGDPDAMIRVADIASRYLPDDPQTIQLYAWADDGMYGAEDTLDNASLCQRAGKLTQVARVLNETQEHPTSILRAFLRSGLWDLARPVLRKRYEDWKANKGQGGAWQLDLAEIALILGEGELAQGFLDSYSPVKRDETPNKEDYLAALRALLPAANGNPEESQKLLETRIREAEDSLYSRLRYVELSLTHPVDPQIREECLKYLIDYAPDEIEYGDKQEGFQASRTDMSEAPRYYQDLLRWIAKGHRAKAEGNHTEALAAYQRAGIAERRMGTLISMADLRPHLLIFTWQERRAVVGVGEGNAKE
jgi:hypothetical protein